MAKKRYDTYGYSPDGKRIDMYVQDGQTYLQDGTRLPSGYTVNTKGGIYKMGDGGGYGVNSHNLPSLSGYSKQDSIQDMFNSLFKFNSDKDYSKMGQDMYKPVYDAKSDAIRNRLNLDRQALDAQTGQIDRIYDQNVQAQNEMNEVAKTDYSNQTLNRGLGRSTIATTGMASMDVANQKQVASINEGRALALQDIHSRIQALTENANQELSTLDSNKLLEERNLAWQLEDRDRGHWLEEAKLNAPMMLNSQQRQWDLEDRQYANAMEQYAYDMGLERNLAGFRGGTLENTLSEKQWQQEMGREAEKTMQEFDLWAENELKRYTPGTNAYKVKQAEIAEAKEMLRYEMSLRPSGGGYSGYSGGKSMPSGSGYNKFDYDVYDAYAQLSSNIGYQVGNSGGNPNAYSNATRSLDQLKAEMLKDPRFMNETTPQMRELIFKDMEAQKKMYSDEANKINKDAFSRAEKQARIQKNTEILRNYVPLSQSGASKSESSNRGYMPTPTWAKKYIEDKNKSVGR